MTWIKRNVFTLVIILLAVCALVALALETLPNLAFKLPDGNNDAGQPSGFQNRAGEAKELVLTWPQSKNLCDYEMALVLDPDKKLMHGTLDFTYVNSEDRAMSELHFLLYANSHEKAQYGIFDQSDMSNAYPNGFSKGSVSIDKVTSNGAPLNHVVTGEQNQVLQIKLPAPVSVGGKTSLRIEYTVTIPNCYGRFGYGDHTMSLVNCNPILSVYANDKWYDYPYYAVGDPFYSEVADYNATITAPSGYTIAATGVLTEQQSGGNTIWTVKAPARRDFGFVASADFEVMQTEVDSVLVRSYFLKGQKSRGKEALDTGAQSITLYNNAFGSYPYAEYSVVEADFFIGGMEYPGMVLIDQSLYKSASTAAIFDLVVSHETGHQWWYSVVGDDEVMNPWLDEGLTEFTTQYFFEKKRDASFNAMYQAQINYLKQARKDVKVQKQEEYSVTLPVFAYPDNTIYSAWVYDRTASILQELRTYIGDDKFFDGLKRYYSANRLGVTMRDDLVKAFENASGKPLAQWFEERIGKIE